MQMIPPHHVLRLGQVTRGSSAQSLPAHRTVTAEPLCSPGPFCISKHARKDRRQRQAAELSAFNLQGHRCFVHFHIPGT